MESDVFKEAVEIHHLLLFRIHDDFGNRHQDLVELGLHRILQLQLARAFLDMHTFVVRQVDSDGLATGIAVATVQNHIVHVQIGIRTRHFSLVLAIHRKFFLQIGQQSRILGQLRAPFGILDQQERLVSSLVAIHGVFIVLDRSNHEIDIGSLGIHPGQIAFIILVGTQSLSPLGQVILEAGIGSQGSSRIQQGSRLGDFFLEKVMIPDNMELALVIATNHRIEGSLVGILQRVELFGSHFSRIEISP